MARTWGTVIEWNATDTADVFTPSTWAVVAQAGTPADGAGLVGAITNAGGIQFMLQTEGASDVLQLYDTVGANPTGTSTTACVASVWCVYGATYDSAGATPRLHRSRFDTGAHAHENADATLAAPPSVGAGGEFAVGQGEGGVSWSGQIAAAAYFPYAMSDGEFERLISGRWLDYSPKFLWESGPRDSTTGRVVDLSRMGSRLDAQSGTSIYAGAGPSGFRFSARDRRR